MRAALIRAAQASPGVLSDIILASKAKPKVQRDAGWKVNRGSKASGRRSR